MLITGKNIKIGNQIIVFLNFSWNTIVNKYDKNYEYLYFVCLYIIQIRYFILYFENQYILYYSQRIVDGIFQNRFEQILIYFK